jgi:hypothetical protein
MSDEPLGPDALQASVERDQLWASLRALRPEIDRLAAGEFTGTVRELELLQLLARIVANELAYRQGQAGE